MLTIGVRAFRGRLGECLKRVEEGEEIIITKHREPIAALTPAKRELDGIKAVIREGLAEWNYGKPKGARRLLKVKGKPLSKIVLEDRR